MLTSPRDGNGRLAVRCSLRQRVALARAIDELCVLGWRLEGATAGAQPAPRFRRAGCAGRLSSCDAQAAPALAAPRLSRQALR